MINDYELVPATGETCRLRNFAPWFLRVGKTKNGMLVLHGNVKKLRTGIFYFLFFSFLRRNFTIFRIFRQLKP